MAPNGETSGLRTALAMGAAKAILVSDDALAGIRRPRRRPRCWPRPSSGPSPTSVLAATESTDGYTGTTPVQVAELLGLPVGHLRQEGRGRPATSVKVERQTEAGYDEVECPLPAVVTVTAGVVEPRYPSFKGIMAAKSKPVDQLTVADLGLDAGQVGAAGARQEVTDVADGRGPHGRRDRRRRGRGLRAGHRVPRAAQGPLGTG